MTDVGACQGAFVSLHRLAITHVAVEATTTTTTKKNVFKLLSYSGIERWERFRRQKVTDSSPPPKSPFRAARRNIIAAFRPDNESKERGTFEMQMQDNNLLKKKKKGSTELVWCSLRAPEIPK